MSVAYHDQAMPILKGAFDRGLNTWDTANIYSNGESERIIGKAIKKYNMPRQKLIILSKCYGAVGEEPNVQSLGWEKEIFQSKDYVNLYGLSRTAIVSSVEASLERLQTSYLDLLQIHRFDPLVPIEETMSTLHDLVKAGKVRYLGASSMWTYQFAMMQSEEEREMIRYCNETGVGIIPHGNKWAPLARGNLARPASSFGETDRSATEKSGGTRQSAALGAYPPPRTEADIIIVSRVEELAKKKGWSMSEVSLAWIKTKVTSPVVGFSSLNRIEEALAVREKDLDEEEVAFLEEAYIPRQISGHT
ncbi:aldo-keto reductase dtxS3 [Physcia stellaris]|nr:aldo-keto reductase dtxS3 [Physcia stellaris]